MNEEQISGVPRTADETQVDAAPGEPLMEEQIPRLARPTGDLARGIPDWDLEPPAFLIRRGEAS